jgi:hypothetical protein
MTHTQPRRTLLTPRAGGMEGEEGEEAREQTSQCCGQPDVSHDAFYERVISKPTVLLRTRNTLEWKPVT